MCVCVAVITAVCVCSCARRVDSCFLKEKKNKLKRDRRPRAKGGGGTRVCLLIILDDVRMAMELIASYSINLKDNDRRSITVNN